ncbi:hypothetical protein ACL1HZ_07380 [Corynebacterium striatum]
MSEENEKKSSARAQAQTAAKNNPVGAPLSVLVAAGIAIVQSVAVMAFGIFLIVRELSGAENASMVSEAGALKFVGLGTAIFIFIVFGFVIIGSLAFVKGKRWGRGAVVLVEFILAASAFQMFSGGSSVLGTITLLSAIAALYFLMFVPASSQWAEANF